MSTTLEGPARELADGRNFAHIAISRPDGTIQTAVVWIATDDDGNLVVNSAEGRAWPANLRRSGGATVSIHNQENPYEFVSIVADLVGDTHDGADAMIDSLAHKYMGVDRYPFRVDGEQRMTFTLAPARITYRSGG